jgi:peptide/nickel transport system permease protein
MSAITETRNDIAGQENKTVQPAQTPFRIALFRTRRHPALLVGLFLLSLAIGMALLAPFISNGDPYTQDLLARTKPPVWAEEGTWAHPLGTDAFGRDYWARLVYGARISLFIGIATALVSGFIGTTLGLLAGYFGGRTDFVIQFLITTRLSMPVVLIALASAVLIGGSLTAVVLILGLLLWDRFAVVVRSATKQIVALDYVVAARAVGASTPYILFREVLPNLSNQLIVIATLEAAHAILSEAALSFLGMGVPPPTPSWGLMVAEGREHILFDAWLILIPGIALFLLVLAINLIGDGIRDVTAPGGRN